MPLTLDTKISNVPLIGPQFERRLEKLDIKTVKDLLWHVPSRYEDFSLKAKANSLQEGEIVTLQGKVLEIKNIFTKNGFNLQSAKIEDETGVAEAIWFNQRFLVNAIHKGDNVSLSGKVKRSGNKLQLEAPQYEVLYGPALHTGRLVPIYPETEGISSKWLRGRIHQVLKTIEIEDFLPNSEIPLKQALEQVHFPDSLELAAKARQRLAFDEILISQLESKVRKEGRSQESGNRLNTKNASLKLPFDLTPAQKRAILEIFNDLEKDVPMNRLLQGDVGSGKTAVAAHALLVAKQNGFKGVLMAPTEILASQHHQTLSKLFDFRVGIATGSIKEGLDADIVVGTHALITEGLNFENLGLVVIDESHRFGVTQRAKLTTKGKNPHILTMTATPIPRTVALTLYGDLDISIIDELPKNRLPIKTWVVPKEKRAAAYDWIKKQDTQSFLVCPLIEESESETLEGVKAAKKEFETLSKVFKNQSLGLLHGKMTPKDKDKVLKDFKDKKIDMLIATPVVEVGIDIPEATIMVIEAADRFGLAQIHQLRGRVGRGDKQSYCLLFTENDDAVARLKNLENLTSGLKLAEVDLKFRGPGQRFGAAQHGRTDFKIADFSNLELIEKASQMAEKVLTSPENFPLLLKIIRESKINIVQN